MLLRYTARLEQEADDVEEAIRTVLDAGYRTPDLERRRERSIAATTSEIGELVVEALMEIADRRVAYHAV
jgi:3-isopropylmalate dehydrogenase